MLDAARHHDAFSGLKGDDPVAKLDAEPATPNQEKFVLLLVMVPGEFTPHFHEFDLLAVQRRNRLRPPIFAKQREFFIQTDLVHFRCLVLS